MATSFRPLQIRRSLNAAWQSTWSAPVEFGPDGWRFELGQTASTWRTLLLSCAQFDDGEEWVHASVATHSSQEQLPAYWELKAMHRAVFRGPAYQVFVPDDEHVNVHANALHLWGRLDGSRPAGVPDFAPFGSI